MSSKEEKETMIERTVVVSPLKHVKPKKYRPKKPPAIKVEKETIFISFSGGRTSAYMVDRLIKEYSDRYNFVITFANTGQEHDETIEFVNKCDKRWGGVVVWLEAVVNPEKGKGTRYRVVTYETCTRRDQITPDAPFVQVIAKYGIPGPAAPQICTRELKGAVMGSYRRDMEKKTGEKYWNAIGIRADEDDRCLPLEKRKKFRVIYPLIDFFSTTKPVVLDYWENQEFDLNLEEHLGNCVTCWKKSKRKHLMIMTEHPEYYDFNRVMEKEHPHTNNQPGYPERRFFRENRTVEDLEKMAKLIPIKNIPVDEDLDGCSESCEAATEETLFE